MVRTTFVGSITPAAIKFFEYRPARLGAAFRVSIAGPYFSGLTSQTNVVDLVGGFYRDLSAAPCLRNETDVG